MCINTQNMEKGLCGLEDRGPFRRGSQGGFQEEVAVMLDLEERVRLGWAGLELNGLIHI